MERRMEKIEELIEHHIHYKEIDGYDETIWMTRSNHKLLHNRLREEGKCNISAEEMRSMASSASSRTEKSKQYHREWYQENKERIKEEYEDKKDIILIKKKEYYEENKERIKAQKREYLRRRRGE